MTDIEEEVGACFKVVSQQHGQIQLNAKAFSSATCERLDAYRVAVIANRIGPSLLDAGQSNGRSSYSPIFALKVEFRFF